MEVDAVEQRAGDALAVVLDLSGGTAAIALGVTEVPAGAGVHGGHEHEVGGEGEAARGPRDGDAVVFERLPQNLEGGPAEFGQLVEKEDSVVGEGDFAGAWIGASAEEPGVRNGVVGGAEWAGRQK